MKPERKGRGPGLRACRLAFRKNAAKRAALLHGRLTRAA